jgi:hypothetical protein
LPLPPAWFDAVGTIHSLRKGLRKRLAVRVGDDGPYALVLVEGGEVQRHPAAELPAAVQLEPGVLDGARSSAGRLVHLAAAVATGRVNHRWAPDELRRAAVAAARDQVAKRLLAVDALAVGMGDLVAEVGLTPSEYAWLTAVRAAAAGDATQVVHAVTALPTDAYRQKLVLLLKVAAAVAVAPGGIDAAGLSAQLQPFLGDEPLAAVLHRLFGAPVDGPTLASDAAWLAEALALPPQLVAAVDAGLHHVLDDDPAGEPEPLLVDAGPNVRALVSARTGTSVVRAEDVRGLPPAIADDLVDAGLLGAAVVSEAGVPGDDGLYLRARTAPAHLTDAELAALDHREEQARRTFPLPDPGAIAELGDSPLLRHFRQLALLRLHRVDEMVFDHLQPPGRRHVEHLLAALAAAEEGGGDGTSGLAAHLTDEVLADPTTWPVLTGLAGPHALTPTASLAERFPAFCEWLALQAAREQLYVGSWSAAVDAADRCLALATAENVRDEALNLKACGLHYLDDDTAAIAALEEAIAGVHSDAHLANIGVVAARLRPDLAARYLARLVRDAPRMAMRVAAGLRACAIWATSDAESWQASDGSSFPTVIRDPLRELVVADVELDDFRAFAVLLSREDAAWFGSTDLDGSPHRTTLEARFYQARARGLDEMVEVMGEAIGSGSPPAWLVAERKSLRDATVQASIEAIDDPETLLGPLALHIHDAGMLETADDKVLFVALGLASVAYNLTTSGDEVADHLVERLHALRGDWDALDDEGKEPAEPIVELATRRVGLNRMAARDRDLSTATNRFNRLVDMAKSTYRGSPTWPNLVHQAGLIDATARSVRKEMTPWLVIVDHQGARRDIFLTVKQADDLEGLCEQFL